MLSFQIRDIGVDGVDVQYVFDATHVRRLLDELKIEFLPDQPMSAAIAGTLEHVGEAFVMRGMFSAMFYVPCARCLQPSQIMVDDQQLCWTFLKDLSGVVLEEGSMDESELNDVDDVETFSHNGVAIDLMPAISEQLVLAVPIAPYCQPDCRGFCGQCGVNLNETSCDCVQPGDIIPSWKTALKNVTPKGL